MNGEQYRELAANLLGARVTQLATLISTAALDGGKQIGICCNKIYSTSLTTPEADGRVITNTVIVLTAPMAPEDVQRINDWFLGTTQDLAQGFATTKIDHLNEGEKKT